MAQGDLRLDVHGNTRPLEQQIAQLSKQPFSLNFQTKGFKNPLGQINGQLGEFEKSLAASNARVLAFGASAGALFAVQAGLKAIITSAIDVEKSLADINVILNLSSSRLNGFSDSLFNIAKDTSQSFFEVAKAATELSRQGLSVEETLKRTQDALILTRLSGLSVVDSVEAITAALNSFSSAVIDSTELVNKLAAVDASFAVSSADLAEGIKRVGSSASDAGLNIDELIAVITSAQQTTARGGAVIGNSFKTIFTRLQRPKVLEQLNELGIQTTDLAGRTLPTIQVLRQLGQTFDNLSSSQQSQIAELVGGVFQINILRASLKDLGREFSIYESALNTSTGATDEAIRRNEALNQTVSALANKTIQNLTKTGTAIGQLTFEPAIKNILGFTNNLLESVNLKQAEDAGSKIATGIFKGLGDFLAGPGLLVAAVTLGKIFQRLTTQVGDAFKTISGIGQISRDQLAIQEKTFSLLAQNPQILAKIQSGELSIEQVHTAILSTIEKQTAALNSQIGIVNKLAQSLQAAGVKVSQTGITAGALTIGPRQRTSSGGFIPNFTAHETEEKLGALRGGYNPGKVVPAPSSIGGVMNTAEDVKYVAGFSQPFINPPRGSKAGKQHERESIKKTGINPYSDESYASEGFIPNFVAQKSVKKIGVSSYASQGFVPNFAQIIDDLARDKKAFPGKKAELPIPDQALKSIIENQKLGKPTYLDVDNTLINTLGDKAYAESKARGGTGRQVLDRFFEDDKARLNDIKSSKLTQFGTNLQKAVKSRVVNPNLLGIITASNRTPGLPEYINQQWGIPIQNQKFGAKPGTKEKTLGLNYRGFIPNFAPFEINKETGVTKVTNFKLTNNKDFNALDRSKNLDAHVASADYANPKDKIAAENVADSVSGNILIRQYSDKATFEEEARRSFEKTQRSLELNKEEKFAAQKMFSRGGGEKAVLDRYKPFRNLNADAVLKAPENKSVIGDFSNFKGALLEHRIRTDKTLSAGYRLADDPLSPVDFIPDTSIAATPLFSGIEAKAGKFSRAEIISKAIRSRPIVGKANDKEEKEPLDFGNLKVLTTKTHKSGFFDGFIPNFAGAQAEKGTTLTFSELKTQAKIDAAIAKINGRKPEAFNIPLEGIKRKFGEDRGGARSAGIGATFEEQLEKGGLASLGFSGVDNLNKRFRNKNYRADFFAQKGASYILDAKSGATDSKEKPIFEKLESFGVLLQDPKFLEYLKSKGVTDPTALRTGIVFGNISPERVDALNQAKEQSRIFGNKIPGGTPEVSEETRKAFLARQGYVNAASGFIPNFATNTASLPLKFSQFSDPHWKEIQKEFGLPNAMRNAEYLSEGAESKVYKFALESGKLKVAKFPKSNVQIPELRERKVKEQREFNRSNALIGSEVTGKIGLGFSAKKPSDDHDDYSFPATKEALRKQRPGLSEGQLNKEAFITEMQKPDSPLFNQHSSYYTRQAFNKLTNNKTITSKEYEDQIQKKTPTYLKAKEMGEQEVQKVITKVKNAKVKAIIDPATGRGDFSKNDPKETRVGNTNVALSSKGIIYQDYIDPKAKDARKLTQPETESAISIAKQGGKSPDTRVGVREATVKGGRSYHPDFSSGFIPNYANGFIPNFTLIPFALDNSGKPHVNKNGIDANANLSISHSDIAKQYGLKEFLHGYYHAETKDSFFSHGTNASLKDEKWKKVIDSKKSSYQELLGKVFLGSKTSKQKHESGVLRARNNLLGFNSFDASYKSGGFIPNFASDYYKNVGGLFSFATAPAAQPKQQNVIPPEVRATADRRIKKLSELAGIGKHLGPLNPSSEKDYINYLGKISEEGLKRQIRDGGFTGATPDVKRFRGLGRLLQNKIKSGELDLFDVDLSSGGFIPNFAPFKSEFGTATIGKTDPIDLSLFSKTLGREIKPSQIASIEDLTTKGKGNASALYKDVATSIKGKRGLFGYTLPQDRAVDPAKAKDPLARLKAKYPQIAQRIGLGGQTYISDDYGRTVVKAGNLKDLELNQDKVLAMKHPAVLTLKSFSDGFIPNFSAHALSEAIAREHAAGIPLSEIEVGSNESLKTRKNRLGLGVFNKDEGSLERGIQLAVQDGINPKTKGSARGFIPNFSKASQAFIPNFANQGVPPKIPTLPTFEDLVPKAAALKSQMEKNVAGASKMESSFLKMAENAGLSAEQIRNLELIIAGEIPAVQKLGNSFEKSAIKVQVTEKEINDVIEALNKGEKGSLEMAKGLLKSAQVAGKTPQQLAGLNQAIANSQKSISAEKASALSNKLLTASIAISTLGGVVEQFSKDVDPKFSGFLSGITNGISAMTGIASIIPGKAGLAVGAIVGLSLAINEAGKSFTAISPALTKGAEMAKDSFTRLSDNLNQFASVTEQLGSARKDFRTPVETLQRLDKKLNELIGQIPPQFVASLIGVKDPAALQSKISQILEEEGKKVLKLEFSASFAKSLDDTSNLLNLFGGKLSFGIDAIAQAGRDARDIFKGAKGDLNLQRTVADTVKTIDFSLLQKELKTAADPIDTLSASQDKFADQLVKNFGASESFGKIIKELSETDFVKFRLALIESANAARRAKETLDRLSKVKKDTTSALGIPQLERTINIQTANAEAEAASVVKLGGGIEALLDPKKLDEPIKRFIGGLSALDRTAIPRGIIRRPDQEVARSRGAFEIADFLREMGTPVELDTRTGSLGGTLGAAREAALPGLIESNKANLIKTQRALIEQQSKTVQKTGAADPLLTKAIANLTKQIGSQELLEIGARKQFNERYGIKEFRLTSGSVEEMSELSEIVRTRKARAGGGARGEAAAGAVDLQTLLTEQGLDPKEQVRFIKDLENQVKAQKDTLVKEVEQRETAGDTEGVKKAKKALADLTALQNKGINASTTLKDLQEAQFDSAGRTLAQVKAGAEPETPAQKALRESQGQLKVATERLAVAMELAQKDANERNKKEEEEERKKADPQRKRLEELEAEKARRKRQRETNAVNTGLMGIPFIGPALASVMAGLRAAEAITSSTYAQNEAVKEGVLPPPAAPQAPTTVTVPAPQAKAATDTSNRIKDVSADISTLTDHATTAGSLYTHDITAEAIGLSSYASLREISQSQLDLLTAMTPLAELPDLLSQLSQILGTLNTNPTIGGEAVAGAITSEVGAGGAAAVSVNPIEIHITFDGKVDVLENEIQAALVKAIRQTLEKTNGSTLAQFLNPAVLGLGKNT